MSSNEGNSGPKTQADSLPNRIDVDLMLGNIKQLEEYGDLAEWKANVENTLRPFQLQDLIRHDLPRPKKSDRGYRVWVYYSETVAAWLYNQCSTEIRVQMDDYERDGQDRYKQYLADEMMSGLDVFMHRYGDFEALTVKMHTFAHIKRSQYETIHHFIDDFQAQLHHLHRLKVPIPWAYALLMLFEQLENELIIVRCERDSIADYDPESITQKEFDKMCETLRIATRDYMRSLDLDGRLR